MFEWNESFIFKSCWQATDVKYNRLR